jgi:hypothetical protein
MSKSLVSALLPPGQQLRQPPPARGPPEQRGSAPLAHISRPANCGRAGEGTRRAPAAERGRPARRSRPGAGRPAGRRVGAARGSGGRGGTSYSSSEAMVGGGVEGGRARRGRGAAPSGRHFVSVGSLRGLRFLLRSQRRAQCTEEPLALRGQCGPAAAGLCAGAAAQRALGARRSLPGGPAEGRTRVHRARQAGAGAAAVQAARRDPRLPLSGVVQKASYLRPKNLPQLLSMPSAAARPGGAALPRSGFSGRPRGRSGRRRGGAAKGSRDSVPGLGADGREPAGRKGRSRG